MRGSNVTFAAPRTIIHADYAIKLTTAGTGAPLHYRGAQHPPCTPGTLNVFAPFEPLVADTSNRSTSFATLLVEPRLLNAAAETLGRGRANLHSPHLRLRAATRALAELNADIDSSPAADLELQLSELLEQLLTPPEQSREVSAPPAAQRVRETILDSLTDNISMEDLEQECRLSRFHLIRLFRKHYGLPPREFRTRARIALARRLLAGGSSQAEAALAVGFFDQSHFHRHFRRLMGVSPGQFQNALEMRGE